MQDFIKMCISTTAVFSQLTLNEPLTPNEKIYTEAFLKKILHVPRPKHLHKEAYCMMKYRCKNCAREETIFNSRDGVTPFIIDCERCGGDAKHVEWDKDLYLKGFKPFPGRRIFISYTYETYYTRCLIRANNMWIKHKAATRYFTKGDFVKALMKSYQEGTPRVITV